MSAAFLVDLAKLTLWERIKKSTSIDGMETIKAMRWDLLDGNSSSQALVRQRQTRFVLFRSISLIQDPSSFIYILVKSVRWRHQKHHLHKRRRICKSERIPRRRAEWRNEREKKYQTFPFHLSTKGTKFRGRGSNDWVLPCRFVSSCWCCFEIWMERMRKYLLLWFFMGVRLAMTSSKQHLTSPQAILRKAFLTFYFFNYKILLKSGLWWF